jgi:hypothetical protein
MPKKNKNIFIENMNYEAQSYCFKKGFQIYPVVYQNQFKVYYSRAGQGKYYMDGKLFDKGEAFQAVWDLYQKIYEYDNNKK